MKTTFTIVVFMTIQAMANAQAPANFLIREELSPRTPSVSMRAFSASEQDLPDDKQDDLAQQEQQLREEIATAKRQLISKQIAASRIKGYMAVQLYLANNSLINELICNPALTATIADQTNTLKQLAAHAFSLAAEIREEAAAQPNPEAQLAELSNAEEKELLALAQQQEVLRILKISTPLFIKSPSLELPARSLIEIRPENEATQKDELAVLSGQVQTLKQTGEALRKAASDKNENEKHLMLEEATAMERDYHTAAIALSAYRYKKTTKTFLENQSLINLYLEAAGNSDLTSKAAKLNEEANYNFRLGKEMREEADAQLTEAARLAELSNAEEKEIVALSLQQQSVQHLKKIKSQLLLASN